MVETGAGYEEASKVLEATDYDVKASIIMLKTGADYELAKKALKEANGNLEKALTAVVELKNRMQTT
jgi:N-acetylmuramic acid 6-phosphate etherase